MGEQSFSHGTIFIKFNDGSYDKLIDITEMPEFETTEQNQDHGDTVFSLKNNYEISFTMRVANPKRTYKRISCGWMAKGPVRARLMKRQYIRQYAERGIQIP